jgi:hypothetical protein
MKILVWLLALIATAASGQQVTRIVVPFAAGGVQAPSTSSSH